MAAVRRQKEKKDRETEDSSMASTSKQDEIEDTRKLVEDTTLTAKATEGTTSEPKSYAGTSGSPIKLSANSLAIDFKEGAGIYLYHVHFDPPVDAEKERFGLLSKHREVLGQARLFDGATLHIPYQIKDENLELKSENQVLRLEFIRKMEPDERQALALFSVLLKRIFRQLNLKIKIQM